MKTQNWIFGEGAYTYKRLLVENSHWHFHSTSNWDTFSAKMLEALLTSFKNIAYSSKFGNSTAGINSIQLSPGPRTHGLLCTSAIITSISRIFLKVFLILIDDRDRNCGRSFYESVDYFCVTRLLQQHTC